jgi:hypothetical protein
MMSEEAFELSCRIKLEKKVTDSSSEQLAEYLLLSNITKFSIKNSILTLKYSVTDIRWPEIEESLKDSGIDLDRFWLNRLRSKWYSYIDENAYSNATLKNPHCCNKPPIIPKKR